MNARPATGADPEFHALFEAMPVPAWIIRGGAFVEVNAAALWALGYADRDAFLRLPPVAVSPALPPAVLAALSRAECPTDAATGAPAHRLECMCQRRDGGLLPAEVTVTRIEWGAEPALCCLWRNLTDHRQAAAIQRHTGQLLDRIGEVAHIGGWELDLHDRTLRWTDELYRLHELSPGSPVSLEQALAFYPPKYRPLMRAAFTDAMEHGTPWDLELPLVTATQRQLWVRHMGLAELRDGSVTRLWGTIQDLTPQRDTEDLLRRLSMAIEQCVESIVITDADARCEYANTAFLRTTGYAADEVMGRNLRLLHSGKTPKAT